jgi:hypothetical protein
MSVLLGIIYAAVVSGLLSVTVKKGRKTILGGTVVHTTYLFSNWKLLAKKPHPVLHDLGSIFNGPPIFLLDYQLE